MFKVERTKAIKKDGKMGKGGKRRIEITNKELKDQAGLIFYLATENLSIFRFCFMVVLFCIYFTHFTYIFPSKNKNPNPNN